MTGSSAPAETVAREAAILASIEERGSSPVSSGGPSRGGSAAVDGGPAPGEAGLTVAATNTAAGGVPPGSCGGRATTPSSALGAEPAVPVPSGAAALNVAGVPNGAVAGPEVLVLPPVAMKYTGVPGGRVTATCGGAYAPPPLMLVGACGSNAAASAAASVSGFAGATGSGAPAAERAEYVAGLSSSAKSGTNIGPVRVVALAADPVLTSTPRLRT